MAEMSGTRQHWRTRLIEHFKSKPEMIPAEVSLYILRSLNPDGLAKALGPDGRVNANGVDLNRNWDAEWQATWNRDGCWDYRQTSAGPYPNSEPETQALIEFLLTTPMDALISYHSAALGIFAGGIPPEPNSVSVAEQVAAVTDYPYPPLYTGCIYTGTLVDWTAWQGIPSIDLELTNHKDTDFEDNLRVLKGTLEFHQRILEFLIILRGIVLGSQHLVKARFPSRPSL